MEGTLDDAQNSEPTLAQNEPPSSENIDTDALNGQADSPDLDARALSDPGDGERVDGLEASAEVAAQEDGEYITGAATSEYPAESSTLDPADGTADDLGRDVGATGAVFYEAEDTAEGALGGDVAGADVGGEDSVPGPQWTADAGDQDGAGDSQAADYATVVADESAGEDLAAASAADGSGEPLPLGDDSGEPYGGDAAGSVTDAVDAGGETQEDVSGGGAAAGDGSYDDDTAARDPEGQGAAAADADGEAGGLEGGADPADEEGVAGIEAQGLGDSAGALDADPDAVASSSSGPGGPEDVDPGEGNGNSYPDDGDATPGVAGAADPEAAGVMDGLKGDDGEGPDPGDSAALDTEAAAGTPGARESDAGAQDQPGSGAASRRQSGASASGSGAGGTSFRRPSWADASVSESRGSLGSRASRSERPPSGLRGEASESPAGEGRPPSAKPEGSGASFAGSRSGRSGGSGGSFSGARAAEGGSQAQVDRPGSSASTGSRQRQQAAEPAAGQPADRPSSSASLTARPPRPASGASAAGAGPGSARSSGLQLSGADMRTSSVRGSRPASGASGGAAGGLLADGGGGSRAGSRPGSAAAADAAGGARPGGSRAGSVAGDVAGGSQAGSRPGSAAGAGASSSRAGSRPGSVAGDAPAGGSRAGSRPGSVAGDVAGGSRPGSRPGTASAGEVVGSGSRSASRQGSASRRSPIADPTDAAGADGVAEPGPAGDDLTADLEAEEADGGVDAADGSRPGSVAYAWRDSPPASRPGSSTVGLPVDGDSSAAAAGAVGPAPPSSQTSFSSSVGRGADAGDLAAAMVSAGPLLSRVPSIAVSLASDGGTGGGGGGTRPIGSPSHGTLAAERPSRTPSRGAIGGVSLSLRPSANSSAVNLPAAMGRPRSAVSAPAGDLAAQGPSAERQQQAAAAVRSHLLPTHVQPKGPHDECTVQVALQHVRTVWSTSNICGIRSLPNALSPDFRDRLYEALVVAAHREKQRKADSAEHKPSLSYGLEGGPLSMPLSVGQKQVARIHPLAGMFTQYEYLPSEYDRVKLSGKYERLKHKLAQTCPQEFIVRAPPQGPRGAPAFSEFTYATDPVDSYASSMNANADLLRSKVVAGPFYPAGRMSNAQALKSRLDECMMRLCKHLSQDWPESFLQVFEDRSGAVVTSFHKAHAVLEGDLSAYMNQLSKQDHVVATYQLLKDATRWGLVDEATQAVFYVMWPPWVRHKYLGPHTLAPAAPAEDANERPGTRGSSSSDEEAGGGFMGDGAPAGSAFGVGKGAEGPDSPVGAASGLGALQNELYGKPGSQLRLGPF